LRTPLQAVIGASQLLSARGQVGQRADEIETMSAASKSLLTLIDSVLSYSRLEAGVVTPTLATFTLGTCIDEALRVSRAAFAKPGVSLAFEIDDAVPAHIRSDPGMLRQVLINLVSNALKFTEAGEVWVKVSAVVSQNARPGDPVRLDFRVTDTGPGIDEPTQRRLFQPFQQGSSAAGRIGDTALGSGLGLVICSMLVRALGGDIELASAPGTGTQMSFYIQAHTPVSLALIESPDARVAGEATSLRPLRVMVVEDNDVNRELLSVMLAQLGHSVFAVADGDAAIQACAEQVFDAVLMDLNMPRVGGIEATRRILAGTTFGHPQVVIIALTASVSEADREQCASVGMRGFLTKPATVFSLDMALRSALIVHDADAAGSAARSTEPDALIDLSVLDPLTLDSLAELDVQAPQPFLRRLIERFLDGLPAQVAEIRALHAASQSAAVVASTHSLAGAASAVGARALGLVARQASDVPSGAHVDEVEIVSKRTDAALRHWIERLKTQDVPLG
jgi:CheY-like chemotaxis protein